MINISESEDFGLLRLVKNNQHMKAMELNPAEQRELLEALARVHGFSLVNREERRELLSHVECGVPDNLAGAQAALRAFGAAVVNILRAGDTIAAARLEEPADGQGD